VKSAFPSYFGTSERALPEKNRKFDCPQVLLAG
jgi:hypothetical protein